MKLKLELQRTHRDKIDRGGEKFYVAQRAEV